MKLSEIETRTALGDRYFDLGKVTIDVSVDYIQQKYLLVIIEKATDKKDVMSKPILERPTNIKSISA